MRTLMALFVLSLLALVGCGAQAGPAVPPQLPGPPSSVVYGPADAPLGGTLVVGVLIPTPPSQRMVDLLPKDRWKEFLAREAVLEAADDGDLHLDEELEETEEVYWEPLIHDDNEDRILALGQTAREVEAKTHVRVLFQDVLAWECEDLPLLLVEGSVTEIGDQRALRGWLRRGGRLLCDGSSEEAVDFGEVRPGVIPHDGKAVEPLVAACLEAIRTSPLVHRLPSDPLELVSAWREGDDVLVQLAASPHEAALCTLQNEVAGRVAREADGTLRFTAPDEGDRSWTERLAVLWRDGDLELRRAWPVEALVGAAELFVRASRVADAGATYAPRIYFLNTRTHAPVAGREVRVALARGPQILAEATAVSNDAGTLDLALAVPPHAGPGPAELLVGDERFPVEIRSGLRVSVVTDRALYRPTDEVHVRVMVHDAAHGRPAPGRVVTLKLGDEEKEVETSAFGIASAHFRLVEAKLGKSHVKASVGGIDGTALFRVQAFERPTFLVECDPSALEVRPGDRVPVRVRVRHVNGSPLVGASVSGTARGHARFVPWKGVTGEDGVFETTLRVPAEVESWVCMFGVSTADGRYAEVDLPVQVLGAARELELHPLEEAIVGRPCRFELRASSPGPVTLRGDGIEEQTIPIDDSSRAVVSITPVKDAVVVLSGPEGVAVKTPLSPCEIDAEEVLVLPDRRIVTVGESLTFRLEGPDGPAYLDVARHDSHVRGLSAMLQDGSAIVTLEVTPDLAGVLTCVAWRPEEDEARGSHVQVLAVRGRSLQVEAAARAPEYRPAETAVVDVQVTDRDGAPTAGVLGYWGVDEALLALEPWKDGREEVFDLLRPGASDTLASLAKTGERGQALSFAESRRALHRVYGFVGNYVRGLVRYRSAPHVRRRVETAKDKVFADHFRACRRAFAEAFTRVPLTELRTAYSLREVFDWLVSSGYLAEEGTHDPWGTPLVIGEELVVSWGSARTRRWDGWPAGYPCSSFGPDLVPGTLDDAFRIWRPHEAGEFGGRLGRFLAFLMELGLESLPVAIQEAPFWGPANNGLIGLGGGAGGAFSGRGGSRDLGGGGGGRRAGLPVHVRRDFSPTLCFVPEAIVGEDGKATLEIPLKDSITTWRLRLVASAASGATGVTESTIRVSQPLHADPWIAPYLTIGDELELPVSLRNETGEPMQVKVTLTLSEHLEPVGAVEATVQAEPRKTAAHVFRYRATARGRATIRVDADSGTARDAIERIVTVRPNAREVVDVANGSVEPDQPWLAVLPVLAAGVPREHRVAVYPSPLAETLDGFEGLIACPHG